MRDVYYDPDEETAYECFACGTIVRAVSNPNECPDCETSMRSRMVTFE